MAVSGRHHAPAALSPGRKTGVNLEGSIVGPTAGLDALVKRQLSLSLSLLAQMEYRPVGSTGRSLVSKLTELRRFR